MAESFPLSLVIKAVDKATGPLQTFGAKVKGVAASVGKAGVAMSAALTAPLIALGGVGVAAFSDFERGMANVSTLVDTGVESLDDMGREVLAISRRAPVGISALTEALYDTRSAGVSAADQFRVLEGSARLAVAGLGTTKEAVDLVTSSMNAFGLQGADAERIYDLVFKTVKTGKTTISGLAQGFGAVAGTVASAGVKLDEYLASVAALTTTGLPAAQAHTQLRAVIAGLTRQTGLTRKVFGRLAAKDFKELVAESGGLVPALERVRKVLGGNDTKMLELLGSTEALNAAIGLTGKQGAAFTSTLADMRTGANALDDAFAKQSKTGVATMQRLRNSLESVAISVGRVLVPVLEQLAPVLERAASWWEGLGGEGQKTLVVLAGAAAALGPGLVVLGKLALAVKAVTGALVFAAGWSKYLWMMRASIMAGLVPSLTAAAGAVWAFTAALLANPITWVVVAVVALGAAAYQVYKNWEPLKEFFVELWDSIVGAFKRAWEKIKPIVDTVVKATRAVFGAREVEVTGPRAAEVAAQRDFKARSMGAAAARPVLGADGARPLAGAARSTEARVTVDFSNLPAGVRVTPARGNTAPLDLDVGYAMGAP